MKLIDRKYGMRWLTAAEGGLAPPAANVDALLDDAVQAIRNGWINTGQRRFLGPRRCVEPFLQRWPYHIDGQSLSSRQMIDRVVAWIEKYPIASVEDALAEEDWKNWPLLNESISHRALALGDDLLCTNPDRIRRAIANKACNALLLKVNQIGTLSEALDAFGWPVKSTGMSQSRCAPATPKTTGSPTWPWVGPGINQKRGRLRSRNGSPNIIVC